MLKVFNSTVVVIITCATIWSYGLEEAPVNRITADIQAGIEKYIDEQTVKGGGYFRFLSDGKEFKFKLVRVHTEYLAKLGPGQYFACVDLVDISGDVYDVDFFLSGEPWDMTVNGASSTTLHKLNGIPFYSWKQNENGTWERVTIEDSPPELLGVIRGKDEFEFLYRIKLPTITDTARMWVPFPQTDKFQKVQVKNINSPKKYQVLNETEYNNKIFYFELSPEDSGKTIDISYYVKRIEKSAYSESHMDLEKYLKSDRLVPVNKKFKKIAKKIIAGKKGTLMQARALYDYVIDELRYQKYGSGWGRGDAIYACDSKTGNCSEYHSYFISLARSVGIPARFAVGAAIPSERNDGGVDGYHCWAEFYAEGKWWPIDVSEADKYSSLATYYFGHHPANRFEFSQGRDLLIEKGPGPDSDPINFLAYPVLKINGKIVKSEVEFSFRRF